MSDILAEAREQVLERGEGLNQEQTLRVLQLPDDKLDELLELAHDVRMKWCGPDVEVEGIISLKTGGCPEDCHFCSQSGLFASPVRSAWLDIPSLVEAAKQTAKTGALIRSIRRELASAASRSCTVITCGGLGEGVVSPHDDSATRLSRARSNRR